MEDCVSEGDTHLCDPMVKAGVDVGEVGGENVDPESGGDECGVTREKVEMLEGGPLGVGDLVVSFCIAHILRSPLPPSFTTALLSQRAT